MNKLIVPCCVIILYSLVSCSRKTGEEDSQTANAAAWTKLEDAKSFLPGWSKENTLIYHIIAEPSDLHPTNGNTSPRNEINLYTQMFLVNTDFRNPGKAPGLVKSLPEVSPDGLRYTYELREEPRWDDGSPLTMDDVIFTCMATKCPLTNNPHAKPYWGNLETIITDPTNPRRFTLVMKKEYIQNVVFLTDYPLLQRKFFDKQNVLSHFTFEQFDDPSFKTEEHRDLVEWSNEFNNEKYGHDLDYLSGIGMYKVVSWEQGQYLTLVKKQNHWTAGATDYHEQAFPDKIIFKLNKDDNSQLLEFKSQAMDASSNLSPKTLMTLKENEDFNKNYNSLFTLSYNFTYIALNEKPDGSVHKKIFDDRNVRRAVAYLVPVDNITRFVYKNYSNQARRVAANVSPIKKECDLSLEPVPFDPAKAKQLLDQAGWKDTDGDGLRDKIIDGEKIPLRLTFQFMNTGEWKDMAAIAAEQMNKAGMKVELLPLDLKVFIEKARSHDFDMMMGVWGGSSQSEDFTQLWHTTSWTNNGSNYSGFGDAQSDALIDSIKYTLDDDKRAALSKRLQRMIYDDQPYVFLYASLRRNVIHKRFGNTSVYAERPGILLNALKLLSGDNGAKLTDGVSPH